MWRLGIWKWPMKNTALESLYVPHRTFFLRRDEPPDLVARILRCPRRGSTRCASHTYPMSTCSNRRRGVGDAYTIRTRLRELRATLDREKRAANLKRSLAFAHARGAEHVVVSGDLTEIGSDAQFEAFAEQLHDSAITPSASRSSPATTTRTLGRRVVARDGRSTPLVREAERDQRRQSRGARRRRRAHPNGRLVLPIDRALRRWVTDATLDASSAPRRIRRSRESRSSSCSITRRSRRAAACSDGLTACAARRASAV